MSDLHVLPMEIGAAELIVEFEFIKGEEPVYNYGDGSGYPGSPDEVHVTSVKYLGDSEPMEVSQLIEDLDLMIEVERQCHEHMED